jgi:hypothetical protein
MIGRSRQGVLTPRLSEMGVSPSPRFCSCTFSSPPLSARFTPRLMYVLVIYVVCIVRYLAIGREYGTVACTVPHSHPPPSPCAHSPLGSLYPI